MLIQMGLPPLSFWRRAGLAAVPRRPGGPRSLIVRLRAADLKYYRQQDRDQNQGSKDGQQGPDKICPSRLARLGRRSLQDLPDSGPRA